MTTTDVNGVAIEDTFAEAFTMRAARVIVTAETRGWADTAAAVTTGYATSVIGCDAEAGVEARLEPADTPDGRPGASLLVFAFNKDALGKALLNRVGQCIMTCPTTACYDGLPEGGDAVKVGGLLRFFGDGFQSSKKLAGRRYWRMPVMDGEFVCEESFSTQKAVAGGNFLMLGVDQRAALTAAEAAVAAIRLVPGVIMPFPGGLVRSGSKVGSRYKALKASTADAYCPSLRGRVETRLAEGANAAYEVVIDGVDEASVAAAMAAGIRAAAGEGVLAITAGNYGGKLGKFHFRLREVLA